MKSAVLSLVPALLFLAACAAPEVQPEVASTDDMLNANIASVEALQAAVGEELAMAILNARPFHSLSDLHSTLSNVGVYDMMPMESDSMEMDVTLEEETPEMPVEEEGAPADSGAAEANNMAMQHDSSSRADSLLAIVSIPINLNSASREEILAIPGVGDRMAYEFEEYRPYSHIGQFRKEIGKYVDEVEVARLEQYIFVPVNLNHATDEQILAIPGVGPRMMGEFKEYRPYSNIGEFHREIGKYVDDTELERLARFVTL